MPRHRPEQELQRIVLQHLQMRAPPECVYFHVGNGGARSPIEAAILKGLGVTAGAPDLLLWHDCRSYAIELKSEAGRVSEAQLEMLNRLSEAGVYTAVCHGLDRALAVLEEWGLLRGQTQ
jgi:VRR-NUC domain